MFAQKCGAFRLSHGRFFDERQESVMTGEILLRFLHQLVVTAERQSRAIWIWLTDTTRLLCI